MLPVPDDRSDCGGVGQRVWLGGDFWETGCGRESVNCNAVWYSEHTHDTDYQEWSRGRSDCWRRAENADRDGLEEASVMEHTA